MGVVEGHVHVHAHVCMWRDYRYFRQTFLSSEQRAHLTPGPLVDGRVTHTLCTVTDVVYKNQTKNKFLNRIRQSTD